MPRTALLLALVATLGGCATVQPIPAQEPHLDDAVLANAAEQVRRCYRSPRIPSQARQIVTRLRIRLTADGQIAAIPSVVEQAGITPVSRIYAERMAQAAVEAVIRCAPLQLPASLRQTSGVEFDLTFSPLARG